jgi:hypothetical protein
VSDRVPDATIKVGTVLLESARLAARHWLLAIVAVAAMAGLFLWLLDLAAWCFGSGRNACIGTTFDTLPVGQQKSLVFDAVTLLPLMAAFLVAVVMLRLFYLGEHPLPDTAAYERPRELRLGRFLARLALVWIIVATPATLLDMGYMHMSWLLYPDYMGGPIGIWTSYLATKAIGISLVSYLRSRLIVFVPCVVYQREPEGFKAAWDRTSAARWRLFAVILIIDLATVFAQVLFDTFAPLAIDFSPLVNGLAAWSHVEDAFIVALLPAAIIYAVVAPLAGLWAAGVSIVAYRNLVTVDHPRISVFD